MSNEVEKSRVFLSYSHKDETTVSRVAVLLKERGIDVWYDEWKLSVGSSLIHEIQEGIRQADFIVVFFSENAMASPWVREEYEASKIRQIESREKVKILPVRLDDCEFPLLMSSRLYADFRYSFVSGFTSILKSILGLKGMNLIDQAFERYARLLGTKRETKSLLDIEFSEFRNMIVRIRDSRWQDACTSAGQLGHEVFEGTPFRSPMVKPNSYYIYKFEERLGNAIRDFLQFNLYEAALSFANQKEQIAINDPVTFGSQLLDAIYDQFNSSAHYFGLPTFRHLDEIVVNDLERIFSFLTSDQSPESQKKDA